MCPVVDEQSVDADHGISPLVFLSKAWFKESASKFR